MMHCCVRRVGVGVAAVLAVLPVHGAVAADGQRTLRLESHAESTSAVSVGGCDAAARCIGTYTGTSTLAGDLDGTFVDEGAVYGGLADYWSIPFPSPGLPINLALFQGDVAGCGHGTVVFSFALGGPDPVDGRVTVIAGSGTGDLTGMRASGHYHLTSTTAGIEAVLSLEASC